jgi:hypothetical protein
MPVGMSDVVGEDRNGEKRKERRPAAGGPPQPDRADARGGSGLLQNAPEGALQLILKVRLANIAPSDV